MSSREQSRPTRLNVGVDDSGWSESSVEPPAVEQPSFQAVVETLFGLNDRDIETLRAIQDEPGATTNEIASVIGRDRSNVNRSLSRLEEIGLVVRRRRLMEAGGFFYEHHAAAAEAVEDRLTSAVEQWAVGAVESIREREWRQESDPEIGTLGGN